MLEKGRGIREQWGSRMKKEKEDEEDSLVPVKRRRGSGRGVLEIASFFQAEIC